MPELFAELSPVARKSVAIVLNRLAIVGQKEVAEALGYSEATISRWKTDHLEFTCKILALIGLKLNPADAHVYEDGAIEPILAMAKRYMQQIHSVEQLKHRDYEAPFPPTAGFGPGDKE